MDDQTEVPDKHLERGQFWVKYRDAGLPGPSYTRPMSHKEALARAKLMIGTTEEISQVEIVPEDSIGDETASCFRVEGDARHEQMLTKAKARHEAAKERVNEDVDASLDEPAIGAFSTPPDEDSVYDVPSVGVWAKAANRRIALDHAMSLSRLPMGGMVVQTAHASPEDIIKNARVFLAFLNEEDAGA